VSDTDAIWQLLGRLADTLDAAAQARREEIAARRRTPEARSVRAAAARQGWEKRHARAAAEAAENAWRDELDRRIGTGPWCDSMDYDSTGRETFCIHNPEHDDDCEDANGHTWPNEEER
jgi:hypothetical protein